MSAFMLALPIVGLIGTGLGHSPFNPGRPTFANFIPHMTGIVGLIACWMISDSNQHRAAWIFLTVPLDGIRSFLRGIFWALLLPVAAVIGLALPILMWHWGILDAALFAIYWLAIASCYLSVELFLVNGLPFANPPKIYHGGIMAPLGAAVATAMVLSGLQWLFIFQDRVVTIGTAMALAASAYVIAKSSLRSLEVNVLHNLQRIASGRTTLLGEAD